MHGQEADGQAAPHVKVRHFPVTGSFERSLDRAPHFPRVQGRVLGRDALLAAPPRTLPRVDLVPRLGPDPLDDRLLRFEPRRGVLLAQRLEFGRERRDLVQRDERLEAEEPLARQREGCRQGRELPTDFGRELGEPRELGRRERWALHDRRFARGQDCGERSRQSRDMESERLELRGAVRAG